MLDLDWQKATAASTTLISLYVPVNRKHDVGGFLNAERSKALNIKSHDTKNAVRSALLALLHRIKTLPPANNGWALFAGDDTCVVVEPPRPVTALRYRCDKQFWLDGLEPPSGASCGVLLVSGKGHTIATCSHAATNVLLVTRVHLPNKHDHGGQSAARFNRLRL